MNRIDRAKHWVPLAFNVMQRFLNAGFVLKERRKRKEE